MTGDPRLLELFAQEAAGQLDRLGDGVLTLERAAGGPMPADVLAAMFRDAHTLKSSAALVGFDAAARLAHGLEDVLGGLRAGGPAPGPGLADDLLRVVDGLRAATGAEEQAGDELVREARAALGRLGSGGAEREPEPAPAPAFTDPLFRQLFVDEVGPQLDRLVGVALDLERHGPDAELIAELFRGAHSLKGSAALVGFDDVAALAHTLEDLLGALRSGARRSSPAIVDGLLGAFDAIRDAVAALSGDGDAATPLAAGRRALETALAADGDGGGEPPAGAEPRAAAAEPPVPAESPAAAEPPAAEPPAPAEPRAPAEPPAQPAQPAQPTPASPLPDPPPAVLGVPTAIPLPAGDLVPVAADRLDRLVRLTGEAVAAELRLTHLLASVLRDDPDAEAAAVSLRRTLRGLQLETLRTRMTSLGALAGPLRRVARDVARASGKEVDYTLEGDVVELDRAVLDGLRDPLLHLVRNAVDHGLEHPDEREAAGKPRRGTVTVRAVRRGPEIVLSVRDDGAGLDLDRLRAEAAAPDLDDEAAAALVFRAGLSTSAAVTNVSGRGVGMDAVRAGVEALRGRVEVASERGAGTTFTVVVPLTLAVVPCVLLAAGGERYALPAHATVALVEDPGAGAVDLEGGSGVWVGGAVVPLSSLGEVVGAPDPVRPAGPALVLEGTAGRRHALRVDAVLGQRDVTVKELGSVLPRSALVSGASIEPDGSVLCVLDPVALVERAARRPPVPAASVVPAAGPGGAGPAPPEAGPAAPSVLVVDDAAAVRSLQRAIFERGGYRVRTADDGRSALELLHAGRPDLVVTDFEMPRLDGAGLCRAIRDTPALASLPVLVVTADQDESTRTRALEAGADGYLLKSELDERRLLDAAASILGRRP
jgi:two-component system chemotaxis sensor kinase CheA